MASSQELTKYVARGRAIMNQLLATGHEIEEEELVASLLAGLPKAYYSRRVHLCKFTQHGGCAAGRGE